MRVVVAVAIGLASAPSLAQGFTSPVPWTRSAQSVKERDHLCFAVTVSSTRMLKAAASATPAGCVPVAGTVSLYEAAAVDTSLFVALGHSTADSCAALERRVGAGSYKVCFAPEGGAAVETLHIQVARDSAGPVPSNDRCEGAAVLARSGRITGDLRGGHNDCSPIPAGACKEATRSRAPERVWAIDLAPGERLRAALSARGADAAIYVLRDCHRWWAACVVASQRNAAGGLEVLTYLHEGSGPQRYFIVVDGRDRSGFAFALDWSVR